MAVTVQKRRCGKLDRIDPIHVDDGQRHKEEPSSKLGRAAEQIASEFKLCVKKFLAIAS